MEWELVLIDEKETENGVPMLVFKVSQSLKLSKHLKGRLGPRVSDVTFLDQRKSVGVPC